MITASEKRGLGHLATRLRIDYGLLISSVSVVDGLVHGGVEAMDQFHEGFARFLDSLEVTRESQIRSRNLRLTALRVFFEYLGRQLPERLLQAQRVVSISTKRTPPPITSYLEREEMEALFAGMPHTGRFALRNRALLLFLFNTGARVQEVADLRVANLDFVIGPRVRLHGNGDKWRLCPLWDGTAVLLTRLLAESGQRDDPAAPVFRRAQRSSDSSNLIPCSCCGSRSVALYSIAPRW